MINFEQELKKFKPGLDKAQVEKAIMKGLSEEAKKSPTQQNKLDQIIKRYNLAVNYCNTNSYDLAYIQIKKVVRLLPEEVDTQLLAALICIHEGKEEQARQAIEQVLKIDSRNETAKAYLEELSVKEVPVEETKESKTEEPAEKTAKKAPVKKTVKKTAKKPAKTVASGSDYEEVTSNKKSFIYLGLGFLIGVVAMFVLVVPTARNSVKNEYVSEADNYKDRLNAKDTEIKSLKEELSDAKADTKKAKEQVEKYKNGDESLIKAANFYNSKQMSEAAKALVDIDEKVLNDAEKQLYNKIKGESFTKATAYQLFNEGKSSYDNQKYKKAIAMLTAATEADNTNPSYYYWLGRAYEDRGQTKTAKKVYQELIEKFPTRNQAKDAQKRIDGMEQSKDSKDSDNKKTEATTEAVNE